MACDLGLSAQVSLPPQTPVRALAFSPDGEQAVSAAVGERHVAVWGTSASKKQKKMQVALLSLSLDDGVVQLDTCSASEEASPDFYLSAVSDSGEAYVWLCKTGEGSWSSVLVCRVLVGSSPAAGHKG